MCFAPYLGIGCVGRRSPNGVVHNLVLLLFTLYNLKMEVPET